MSLFFQASLALLGVFLAVGGIYRRHFSHEVLDSSTRCLVVGLISLAIGDFVGGLFSWQLGHPYVVLSAAVTACAAGYICIWKSNGLGRVFYWFVSAELALLMACWLKA